MKKSITIILLGVSTLLYSQIEFEAKNINVLNEVTGKLTIEKYDNKELYKNQKCNFLENTPEQKFCDFFNLNTKEELINFFNPYAIPSNYAKEDYLSKMKVYDNKSNFYILDSKYILDYGISKDIFIKYVNTNEAFPKPIYSAFYLQDFLDKLIVKDMGENFDIGLFLVTSNTNRTINYLNKNNSEPIDITLLCTNVLDNIKNQSKKNNAFELIDKKYSPFFSDKNEAGDTEGTLKNTTIYSFKKSFHDIISSGLVFEKKMVSKKEISQKYNINETALAKDSLSVKEVINVNTMNSDFQIIKFHNSNPVIKTNYKILNNDIAKYNNLLTVLMKLNFEVFINIFSDEKSNKFPEINQFKKQVKRTDGVLDVFKLAKVIKENKAALSKYLDN